MEIKIIDEAKVIMSNPDSRHNYFGWPTVEKLKNGRIVVGASGYRLGHVCPFGKGCITFSENNGDAYLLPVPVIDTVLDDRDVGLCAFGDSGLIVTSFNNTRKMQRHHANGIDNKRKAYTYGYLDLIDDNDEEEAIGSNFRISYDNGVSFSKTYKSPITSPHGPIEMMDGTVLWVGSNYYNDNNVEAFNELIEVFSVNTNNGEMVYVGKIPDIIEDGIRLNPCEPYAIETSDGTLICHIRTEETFTTYQSVSYDKGKNWTVPERLLDDFGGAPCHIIEHSSGVLISLYGYRTKPYGIRAMFSVDGGKSWDTDYDLYINGISDDLGYPATVELEDGTLLTVFYAKQEKNGPCVIMQIKWKI